MNPSSPKLNLKTIFNNQSLQVDENSFEAIFYSRVGKSKKFKAEKTKNIVYTLVYDRNFFSFKMGRFQFTGKFAGDK